ncbi:MAG: SRPBCC domain-containing protein [Pseudanabaenales cyanobacterium]|nr:SRPBCC domain-containing protein [Pseudanabaenales cyanobacterium]
MFDFWLRSHLILMPSLYTEIEIEAPKEHVWEVLFRKEDWRQWNTFLFDCDPTKPFQRGREVSLSLRRLEGEEETEFQPTITLIRPSVCLRWVSKVPGLQNEYTFELQEIGPGRTKYIHRDNFSGLLSGVFLPFIRQDEKQGLKRMARQLKRYIERGMIYDRR